MYAGDNGDVLPNNGMVTYLTYKSLLKNFTGLNHPASAQDKLFAWQSADTYYYAEETNGAYVTQGMHEQVIYDYSSYVLQWSEFVH